MSGPFNRQVPPMPHSANAMPPPPPPLSAHYPLNSFAMRNNSPPAEYLAAMNIDPNRPQNARPDATAMRPSVRLESPITFEGFTLRKDTHPPFGETPSWSRVKEVPMAATMDELSKRVQKRGKSHDFLKDYQNLRSGRQRVSLDRLIDDKRRSERDPTVEWVIASIEEERGHQERRRNATETKALHVILKRQSKQAAKGAKKVETSKPDRRQRASAPPAFYAEPDHSFNYQSMYGGPMMGIPLAGGKMNAAMNNSQPQREVRQPQTQSQLRPTTLPPILLSNEGRPLQEGAPGLGNFMPGSFPPDGFPATSFTPGAFPGGPMYGGMKPQVSSEGGPSPGVPKPGAPFGGNKFAGGTLPSKKTQGAVPSFVNIVDENNPMRRFGTTSKQQKGKPQAQFGGNGVVGGTIPLKLPLGAFPHFLDTMNEEDPMRQFGSTKKQQKGKPGARFGGDMFTGSTLPSQPPPGAFPQFMDEEELLREYGSTSKPQKGKPVKAVPIQTSSRAKENPMFANMMSASDSSDDESSDTSFQFSNESVDLSTPLSSPMSTSGAFPPSYSNPKRQSYDFMTEIRDGKFQNQGKYRTKRNSRDVLEDMADIKQNRNPRRDPVEPALDEAQYPLPRTTGRKGSSIDDDGRASWRSSVTAVEALEQEYIRKLEHLRREEVWQLDQRLREAEEHEREREREQELENRKERQREDERQRQHNREPSRERNNRHEREKGQERYTGKDGERSRPSRGKSTSRSRQGDRSPRPYGNRFYSEGGY